MWSEIVLSPVVVLSCDLRGAQNDTKSMKINEDQRSYNEWRFLVRMHSSSMTFVARTSQARVSMREETPSR